MNRRFAAVVVVAVLAITGCTTGQPSGGGSASPSLASPSCAELVSDTNDEPAQPGSQPRSGLDSRWPARCRHLQDRAVGHGLLSERQPGCSPSPAHDAIQVTLTVPDGWAGTCIGSIVLDRQGE